MPPKRTPAVKGAAPTRRSARTPVAPVADSAPAPVPAKKAAAKGSKKRERTPSDAEDDEPEDEEAKPAKAPPKKKAKATATTAKAKAAAAAKAKAVDDEDEEPEEDEDEEPAKAPPKKKAKAAPKAKAAKSKAAAPADEDEDAEDDKAVVADVPTTSKRPSRAKAKPKASAPADDDDDMVDAKDDDPPVKAKSIEPPAKMVKVLKRGAAPVDPESTHVNDKVVYAADGEVWDAMLNQTNVSKNNNKFYVIQLLHPIGNPSSCLLHTRWGRVGERGSSQDKGPWSPAQAIAQFKSQFKAKAGANWDDRRTMTAKSGKYMWLERDYNDDEDDNNNDKGKGKAENKEKSPEPEVVAPQEVQTLVQFIFNTGFITAHLAEMNYDANKLPLGKLSKNTILNGFGVLKILADILNDPTGPAAQAYVSLARATEDLSNQYYSIVPHSFGRNRPIIINNEQLLKKELEVLDALGDMEIASKVLSSSSSLSSTGARIHPIDAHLASLQLRSIEPLARSSLEFRALERYTHDTHGSTHSHYKVNVESIFRIEREGEFERWQSADWQKRGKNGGADVERMLLWHGSRSTNFAGILKQGLRIAPPEAPVTGYMFGKGAYFADHMSKSANYCYAQLSQNTGLLLLAEVAVAPFNELIQAKYDADVDCKAKNLLATKGIGRVQPKEWKDCAEALGNEELKGVKMPYGPGAEDPSTNAYLQYNEYIVYDVSQIRLRYLLKIKMQ